MSTRATKTGASASPLQRPFACRNGAYVAEFGGYCLESALQPIFSLSHQRPVGCEALIRARDAQGKYVPPPFLFGSAKGLGDVLRLDRICRSLHLANFRALDAHNIWLFLNVNPLVAIHESQNEASFKEVLEQYQIPTHQVVAEIVETAIADETVLERSVNYYKQLGCMVAIDDFGAGHSNFERIWRLAPDIVKLDRAMVEEAARRDLIARSLPDLVSLLHHAGCIVLAEGVETEAEALTALNANVDLAQGYLFGRPSSILEPPVLEVATCRRVHQRFKERSLDETLRDQQDRKPYIEAFERCAAQVTDGTDPARAAAQLFDLDRALCFYVLDDQGNQAGENFVSPRSRAATNRRLQPLASAKGASWYHRPYFRQALSRPGTLQISSPYLSLPDAKMCLTLSKAVEGRSGTLVLCFDIGWHKPVYPVY